jgi:putative component of membrane protein insertase Oxa1/YidC/SpoIIIJ protein YidD
MNGFRTRKFISDRPHGYRYLEVVYRQMNRRPLAMQVLREYQESLSGEPIMHCGLLDVRNGLVYHFSENEWRYETLDYFKNVAKFGITDTTLYYEQHKLSNKEQLEALVRAYRLRLDGNTEPYCLFYNNCQTFAYEVLYGHPIPGQVVRMVQVACQDLLDKLLPSRDVVKTNESVDCTATLNQEHQVPRNDALNVHCTSDHVVDHRESTRSSEESALVVESYKDRFCSTIDPE